MNKIRAVIVSDPNFRCFRNNTGKRKIDGRWIVWGLAVGSADLIGLYKPTGKFLSFEIKMPKTGVESDAQKIWQKTIRDFGGVAEFVRSVEEIKIIMDKIRKGEL